MRRVIFPGVIQVIFIDKLNYVSHCIKWELYSDSSNTNSFSHLQSIGNCNVLHYLEILEIVLVVFGLGVFAKPYMAYTIHCRNAHAHVAK